MRIRVPTQGLLATAALLGASVVLASPPDPQLTIKDHAFSPSTLTIPADTRVKILIHNQDPLPAEFESYEFNREKVIPGGSTVSLYVGPLKAGRYNFFNDFYSSSTGTLIVKPQSQE